MVRRIFFFVLLAGVSAAGEPEVLKINADKLVYLEKGNIAEFKKNVKFSKEGFSGNSGYLRFDKKKRKIFAEGKVYIILESTTARKVKLWTEKISYTEKDDKISSPSFSRFLVFTSTSRRADAADGAEDNLSTSPGVYEITCDSFYGFAGSRRFYLSGKPVIINGENLKGMSDFVDFSNDVIDMRGNASLDYTEEKPYQVLAEFIRIDTVRDLASFKKDVEGTFYGLNPDK